MCQRPGSPFLLLLLLLLLHIETSSSRVCCNPGLPESAHQVASGSLRCIVIISISWWRLPRARRCLALAAEDRKSEVRSQPLRTQTSHHTCESTSYIFSVARICDAQIAALSAAQRRHSKLPPIQAWVLGGPARAWPIVPDRELNAVYASRTIAKCISMVVQA